MLCKARVAERTRGTTSLSLRAKKRFIHRGSMVATKLFAAALVAEALLIAACGDATPYQAVPNERGSTLVVNRYTGTTYKVAGERLLELSKRSLDEQTKASEPKD